MSKQEHKSSEIVSEAIPKYKVPTSDLPFEEGKRYTYADYITWPEQIDGKFVRYELYEGVPYIMDETIVITDEAPHWRHQKINRELVLQLATFLKNKPCEVFYAPFDVRFNPDSPDETVLQPDILVICDKSVKDSNHAELDGTGCKGVPDMIIEILSPGSVRNDRLKKLHLYEKYGVREYWIVEPDTEMLTVYILKDGQYTLKVYDKSSVVPVYILEGCIIDLAEVFAGE